MTRQSLDKPIALFVLVSTLIARTVCVFINCRSCVGCWRCKQNICVGILNKFWQVLGHRFIQGRQDKVTHDYALSNDYPDQSCCVHNCDYFIHFASECQCSYVTRSWGMSRMSGILILSYRLKEVINSYVLYCFWTSKNCSYLHNRYLIEMGFRSKCSI